MSEPVSRVLSRTTIYLDPPFPCWGQALRAGDRARSPDLPPVIVAPDAGAEAICGYFALSIRFLSIVAIVEPSILSVLPLGKSLGKKAGQQKCNKYSKQLFNFYNDNTRKTAQRQAILELSK